MLEEQIEHNSQEGQAQGRWELAQHEKFLLALMLHGKNWKMIEEVVLSRSTAQVRSHAQKFFLKLHKIEKERKKNHKKGITQPSKADEQLTKSLLEQTICADTPSEILAFLKREAPKAQQKSKDQPQPTLVNLNQKLKHGKSPIIEDLMQGNDQESFLVSLIRQSRGFGDPEQALNDMIEFPEAHREEKEEEQTSNKRKKSFSLYEQEDQGRYYGALKKMRGQ